ncbi:MAG: hypothetical protein K0S88_3650 [Actinomycetia bacterium]|nr:hypothetical protein [Actinomycetes bacterium]
MAARSALDRAPHKSAGGLLLTAGVTIVMGIITAEALYTNPYNARMEISDLGATETGVVLHPSSTIFNATMLVAGAMIITAAFLAHRAPHRRAVTIPTGLLGIGVLGVGIFPGNIHPQHPLFAYTAFLAGGLAVLLSAWVTPQPLRAIFAVMGTISLAFTLASVSLLEWGPFARLDLGGVERWMVYPVLLWLVGFGGYLAARQPEQAPQVSLPATTAQALNGHNEPVSSSR